MGLFDRLFGRAPKPAGDPVGNFQLLTGYEPSWHISRHGSIYEEQMIRAAINAAATHISKLKPVITGSAKPSLRTKLEHGPNEWRTWSQFLYQCATILFVDNSVNILPVFDDYGEISGIYCVAPERCEIVEYGRDKRPYLRYHFKNGKTAAIELELCGIMTRFQFQRDLYGDSNDALYPTMDLIRIANQGITEGVKNSNTYRFMARVGNFAKDSDLAKERRRFSRENFGEDAEASGVLLFPSQYTDIRQLESKPLTVDAEQMDVIRRSVSDYFGVSPEIIQNTATPEQYSAFYEGICEPFAIQFSEVCSRMLYTYNERSRGAGIMLTSNRLQYMSNADKLAVSTQLVDRGIMSRNDAREIWNLPPVEGGDELVIRGEYYEAADHINNGGNDDNGQND